MRLNTTPALCGGPGGILRWSDPFGDIRQTGSLGSEKRIVLHSGQAGNCNIPLTITCKRYDPAKRARARFPSRALPMRRRESDGLSLLSRTELLAAKLGAVFCIGEGKIEHDVRILPPADLRIGIYEIVQRIALLRRVQFQVPAH